MSNFNIGALSDWFMVGAGEVLDFSVPEAGFRIVDFDVISNGKVSIHAVSGEAATLVAYSDGMFNVRFSTSEQSGVGFHMADDVSCYVRTKFRSQEVPASDEPTFTSIEPRAPSVAPEIMRMMQLAKLHARQREQLLLNELAAMREQAAQAPNGAAPTGGSETAEPPLTGDPDASDDVVEK